MANDLNLFVLWANGRHKETEIINDINRHFEILQSFEITWTPKLFTRNLSRFYGKKLPSAVKRKDSAAPEAFWSFASMTLSREYITAKISILLPPKRVIAK